jgi:hypothetical protein
MHLGALRAAAVRARGRPRAALRCDAPCRHHFSTPDTQLLQASLSDRDRQLCDMDVLLLELVLQVTQLARAPPRHSNLLVGRRPR